MLLQPPWELIAMYRGLLLADRDDSQATLREAIRWFEIGISVADAAGHGVNLVLIKAMTPAAGLCWFEHRGLQRTAELAR